MNSEILSKTRNKLKSLLKDKDALDVIVFGSTVKGKTTPNDVDIAVITNKKISLDYEDFHVSVLSPDEFFTGSSTLITTLLKEGYSLKNKKSFSETLGFRNKVLFTYTLSSLKNSAKVKIVNILRGKKTAGMVEECGGKWLAPQVFICPISSDRIFEQFFINSKIKFQKSYVLIH
ncbi:MAG: nucleotidyltransferase domain-containing protein [Nanoarchaeota archaeon]|nr:nucleotidyltransferase domain-containing protein [Nanoarchaeota archaeon]